MYVKFGELLRECRLKNYIGQQELADEIGMSPSTLCKCEKSGMEISIDSLKKIVGVLKEDAFRLQVQYCVDYIKQKYPNPSSYVVLLEAIRIGLLYRYKNFEKLTGIYNVNIGRAKRGFGHHDIRMEQLFGITDELIDSINTEVLSIEKISEIGVRLALDYKSRVQCDSEYAPSRKGLVYGANSLMDLVNSIIDKNGGTVIDTARSLSINCNGLYRVIYGKCLLRIDVLRTVCINNPKYSKSFRYCYLKDFYKMYEDVPCTKYWKLLTAIRVGLLMDCTEFRHLTHIQTSRIISHDLKDSSILQTCQILHCSEVLFGKCLSTSDDNIILIGLEIADNYRKELERLNESII